MSSLGHENVELRANRITAARLSSAEDWRKKPTDAFKKFIRATPFRQGQAYSEVSVLQHEARFSRFFDFMATKSGIDILNIGVDHISMFLAELQGRDPAQPGSRDPDLPPVKWVAQTRTINHYVKLLDNVFNGLALAGYRSDNPVLEAQQLLKSPKGRGRSGDHSSQ